MSNQSEATEPLLLHATAVAIGDAAVMIRGPSGAGKSDLALRLLDRGATLVSDDYVEVRRTAEKLWLSPPAHIAGKLEVRALGILEYEHMTDVELRLIVDLAAEPDRFPVERQSTNLLGIAMPCCTLNAMETSTAIKVELALRQIVQGQAGI